MKEKISIQQAVDRFRKELRNDEGFRESYKANIAMAFKDEYSSYKVELNKRYLGRLDIHKIANVAANNFLNLLCMQTKEEVND